MHRFHLPIEKDVETELKLNPQESAHAVKVLRLQEGQSVAVLNGKGWIFDVVIRSAQRREVLMNIQSRRYEPPPATSVWLFQAVAKSKSMDWIVQKAAELGVSRIVPLITERGVPIMRSPSAAEDKRQRWRQIAIEAIKQSGNPWLPEIEAPQSLSQAFDDSIRPELNMAALIDRKGESIGRRLQAFFAAQDRAPASVGIFIGPEGDFTAEEIDTMTRNGTLPVVLGPHVLRSETAAVYALSALNEFLLTGLLRFGDVEGLERFRNAPSNDY